MARDERGRWDTGTGAVHVGESFGKAVEREVGEGHGAAPRLIELLVARNVLRRDGDHATLWVAVPFPVLIDPAEAALGEPGKFDAIE